MKGLSPKRRPKNCTFSETSVEQIKAYAQAHGMNFSRTIEGLALMALEDTQMLGVVALLQETIRIEVMRQYNRMAKLTVHAGLQAGEAKETARAIYWWIILQEQRTYLAELQPHERPSLSDLEARFRVDQKSPAGQQAVSMLQRRQGRYRYQAVKTLRSAIEELHDIMEDLEQWADRYQEPDEASEDAAEDAG